MKQGFMNVAKRVTTLFSAGLLVLSLSFGALAQDQSDLLLPAYPASFEAANYGGQKGCVPDNAKYIFAVMENEGMVYLGRHPKMDTTKSGLHFMDLMYNPDKGYGYTMSNIGNGMQCVTQKLTSFKFHNDLNLMKVKHSGAIKPEDCAFEPPMLNLCGTFEQISGRLTGGGYSQNWQAINEQSNAVTMFSGTGQSWLLTTNHFTGATVFTGAGKGEFEFLREPKVQAPNLDAKNN